MSSQISDFIRDHLLTLPDLAKFALGLILIVTVPRLCRLARIPSSVGLLLGGVVIGPYVLGIFGTERPIADFMADIGKLLLMFFAGLEIDVALFRRTRHRSIAFGLTTTAIPLLLGTAVGLAFSYSIVPAIVIGSLLASHTLLGLGVISRLGAQDLEPVTVTVGATVMSDTLSLVVFAVCVSIYTLEGFSLSGLVLLLAEIVGYIVLVLFGLSRLGAYLLRKVEDEEERVLRSPCSASWRWRVCWRRPLSCRVSLAHSLRGSRSTHTAPRHNSASTKLEFLGRSPVSRSFFAVTGFLINPVTLFSEFRLTFLTGWLHHCRAPHRKRHCGLGCRPGFRLHA